MKRLTLVFLLFLVSCTVYKAELSVDKSELNLDNLAAGAAFTLANVGEEMSVLDWRVSSPSDAVSFDPATGSLDWNDTKTVRVSVADGSLKKGETLETRILIRSNGGSATIDLSYEMTDEGFSRCGFYPSDAAASDSVGDLDRGAAYVPGQLLVQYRSPALVTQGAGSAAEQARLHRLETAVNEDYELRALKEASYLRPALVALEPGQDVLAAARRLSRDERVAYAHPNYLLQTLALNDPFLDRQWYLLEFGLEQAWDIETGAGEEVVVAVIDNGFDTAHEDLFDKFLPGCDFYAQDNNPQAGPSNDGHGTHVAGIAAAVGNNGRGIAGVAYGPNVKLLPVKVLPDVGVGSVDPLLDAMLWSAGLNVPGKAVNPNPHPAQIISISLGIDPKSAPSGAVEAIDEVAEEVFGAGVFVVAASGNSSSSDRIFSPASSPHVYAVGSVDSDHRRSNFSNYASGGASVDFVAPGGVQLGSGESIYSTDLDNGYQYLSGTSMATPFVAGAAALVLSRSPGLSPRELAKHLSQTADFDPAFMSEPEYGAGIICVDRALGAPTRCGVPE